MEIGLLRKILIIYSFATLFLLHGGMYSMEKKAFGSWSSPITSKLLVKDSISFADTCVSDNALYFSERRPQEGGRISILKKVHTSAHDILEKPYNAKTSVHEYGGGAFCVYKDSVFFSNGSDHNIYHLSPSGKITQITHTTNVRYADGVVTPNGKFLYLICEDHTNESNVTNKLIHIDLETYTTKSIASGHDFYSSPKISPSGDKLSFIAWDHPNMPWDGSYAYLASIQVDGTINNLKKIAGSTSESVYQVEFAPDNTLHFISDKTGFWNLYRYKNNKVENIYLMEAEFGQPQWILGTSRYTFIPTEDSYQIAAIITIKGLDQIVIIDPEDRVLNGLDLPFSRFQNLRSIKDHLYFIAGSPISPFALIEYDLRTHSIDIVKNSQDLEIDPGFISIAEAIEYESQDGEIAYGLYYPPTNPNFKGLDNELPPLIVKSHGGPTGHVDPTLNLHIQYFTSRGYGFLDVNYGGSTGFGKAYRERLVDKWGQVDVDDCVNGALYLANQNRVDKNRLIIKGGSAGGYTTLAALTFRNVFRAGVSSYGVSDLEGLAKDTHKFEARYLDNLIGPYPEAIDKYKELSPINHTESLTAPILFLQGEEDKVVPKNQAEKMVAALDEKQIPVAYILFEKEGHGFRIAKNMIKAIEAELCFYLKILKLPFDKKIPSLKISHLKE